MKTALSSFGMTIAVTAAIFVGLTAAAPASAQLQDALDNTSLTFTIENVPGEEWFRVTDVSHDGNDSARSGSSIDTGMDSGFSTTVTGPGTISFWWKVSSQPNADLLYFFDNSSMKAYIGGEVDWAYQSFALDAGTHTLTWTYMKDYAVSQGSDCGWVDQVEWNAGAPDTTPPGDVSGFTLMPGDRMVAMSWTNPGDADLAGVKILRKEDGYPTGPTDGATVFDGPGTTAVDYGVQNSTTYYYRAFAYDGAPNYAAGVQALTYPGPQACCGAVTGDAGRVLMERLYETTGGTYINFDDLANGTKLDTEYQAQYGVTFWTTKTSTGAPISPPHNVVVSTTSDLSPPNAIVGTPSIYSGDDGRYAYEIRFDEPQRWAGVARTWSPWNANILTRFYTPSGALLAEVNVYPQSFAGYLACSSDTNEWIAKIECDGLNAGSIQVGYTDDLYFGTGPDDIAPETWRYAYDSPGADQAFDIAIDSAGDLIVGAGYTDTGDTHHDALLYKVTPGSNDYQWAVTRSKPSTDWADRIHSVLVDAQDNVYAFGMLGQAGGPYYTETFAAKYTPDGSNLWENIWHENGGTEAIVYDADMAPDGTIYAACHVDVSAHNYILWEVLKYAPTGFVSTLPSTIYDNPSTYALLNAPYGIAVADDHRLCVVGRRGNTAQNRVEWHVRYYDASQSLAWSDTQTSGAYGKSGYAYKVDLDAAGNPVVVGWIVTPSGRNDGLAIKYDAATGDVLWSNRCARGVGCVFRDVYVDDAGDVLIAGYCVPEDGVAMGRLLKLDGVDGSVLAEQYWPGESIDLKALDVNSLGVACAATMSNDAVAVWMALPDETAPEILLAGDNPLELARGTAYVEPGYSASDDIDGNITANVSVTGSVDHTSNGSYLLYYNVSDSAGNAAVEQMRTVHVVDPVNAPPAAPGLMGPTGTVTETRMPVFVWQALANADWYQLTISRNGNPYYSKWFRSSSFTSTWNFAAGNYAWTVRGWNTYGTGSWASEASFEIPIRVPDAIVQLSPVKSVDTGRPTFDWEDDEDAAWYHLVVQRSGKSALNKWVQAPASEYTPLEAETLQYGNYAWWIQGWGFDGLGPWSGPMRFDYGDNLNLVAPHGRVEGTRQPAFEWTLLDDADWYHLWLGRNGGTYYDKWFQTNGFTPTWNLPFGEYTWYVQAWNPQGVGPWSEEGSFTIGEAVPMVPSGAGAAPNGVQWDDAASADAAWYHIVIQRNGNPYANYWVDRASVNTGAPGEGAANIPIALQPLPPDDYTWWIQAWAPGGSGPWSDGTAFTVLP